jgi:hypothetical protein
MGFGSWHRFCWLLLRQVTRSRECLRPLKSPRNLLLTSGFLALSATTVFAESSVTVAAPLSASTADSVLSIFNGLKDATPLIPESSIPVDSSTFAAVFSNISYADQDGKDFEISNLSNKKVLVYVWSIYCRSCVESLRSLQSRREELSKQGIELITVHLFETDRTRLNARLAQLQLGVPILFGTTEIRDALSVTVLPTALLYDEERAPIARFEGDFDPAQLAQLR